MLQQQNCLYLNKYKFARFQLFVRDKIIALEAKLVARKL